MRRRQVILGGVTLVGAGGCLGTAETNRSPDPGTPVDGTESGTTTTAERDPPVGQKGPRRGEASPGLSVHVTESDGDVEYLPQNDSVRFVSARSGDDSIYTVRKWETWAGIQCTIAARDHAVGYVREALREGIGGAVGDDRVFVDITTKVDSDGDVFQEPPVEFDRLVTHTPRSVTATYNLDDHEYTQEVPVYARLLVLHLE